MDENSCWALLWVGLVAPLGVLATLLLGVLQHGTAYLALSPYGAEGHPLRFPVIAAVVGLLGIALVGFAAWRRPDPVAAGKEAER